MAKPKRRPQVRDVSLQEVHAPLREILEAVLASLGQDDYDPFIETWKSGKYGGELVLSTGLIRRAGRLVVCRDPKLLRQLPAEPNRDVLPLVNFMLWAAERWLDPGFDPEVRTHGNAGELAVCTCLVPAGRGYRLADDAETLSVPELRRYLRL